MENEQVQTQYKVLSKRVDAALEVLNDLQQRDDNMYRVILQAEPVNDEIRNNGTYNPSRYENLLQMSDVQTGRYPPVKKVDILCPQGKYMYNVIP